MIDPRKPIRFKSDPDRPLTLVGAMPSGDLVITATYGDLTPWSEPILFNRTDGKAKKPGCSLVIENAPIVSSGFFPVRSTGDPYGRGLINLAMAKDEYGGASFFVEIIRRDGVPFDAKIHTR